jgi:hypothetical protein
MRLVLAQFRESIGHEIPTNGQSNIGRVIAISDFTANDEDHAPVSPRQSQLRLSIRTDYYDHCPG